MRALAEGRGSTRARVLAIARRDLTIELSYQFALVVRLGQVLFLCTTLYFISRLVQDPPELAPYGGAYFAYAVIGLVVTTVASLGLGNFSRSINDEQRAGTLELLLATPTSLPTLLAGAFVVPLLLTAVEIVVYLSIGAILFSLRLPATGLLLCLPVIALTVLTFCSFGILSASFIVLTKRGDPFTLLATQATTFLAGAVFPVALLPGPLQLLAKLVPAYHSLEAMRSVLLADAGLVDILDELAILALSSAVLLPLSLAVFSRSLRWARRTGTLGNF